MSREYFVERCFYTRSLETIIASAKSHHSAFPKKWTEIQIFCYLQTTRLTAHDIASLALTHLKTETRGTF